MSEPARRPWWKRKRWWAAGALWLLVAYPLSVGPVVYAVGRGWAPMGLTYFGVPATEAVQPTPLDGPYAAYLDWWIRQGFAVPTIDIEHLHRY